MTIYLDDPEITESDIAAVEATLRKGSISTAHDTTRKFEEAVAEYLGVPDAVAVNSGTSALHLACLDGSSSITIPATSFVGTANAILYAGKEIKIEDVNKNYWTFLSDMAVSLYGCFFIEEHEIHRCRRIWDLAESIHAKPIKRIDTKYDYWCYSLNGNKTITGGAGGIVVGPNLEDIKRKINSGHYSGMGFNYRMPSLNAALALSQLQRVEDYCAKKRKFLSIYKSELTFCTFQQGVETPWLVACLFPEHVDIPTLQAQLLINHVPTRRIFKPLNHYKHLEDGKEYPNAEYIYKHGLCLPTSVKNEPEDIFEVCRVIRELV